MLMTLIVITFPFNLLYTHGDNNVGTVLFSRTDLEKRCWTAEEMTLLNSRKIFEQILPSKSSIEFKNDDTVDDLVLYFQMILRTVKNKTKSSCKISKIIMMRAMADTLGGYLYAFVLPLARSAFYAGVIQFESIQKLNYIFEEIKLFLKTNGEGWTSPNTRVECTAAEALPLKPPHGNLDPCEGLLYQKQERGQKGVCYEIPMPILDSVTEPSSIAVPFKTYSLRKLESSSSAYILVKYYVAAMRCYMSIKAQSCCIAQFHKRFQHWLNTRVSPHTRDTKTYAAFGGVYRVLETIKQFGDGVFEQNKTVPKTGGSCTYKNENKKNNIILVALLATIFVWFLIGSIFICFRLNSAKGESYNIEIGTSTSCKTTSMSTTQFSTQTSSKTPYSLRGSRSNKCKGLCRNITTVCCRQQQTQSPSIMSSFRSRSRSCTSRRHDLQNMCGNKSYQDYQQAHTTGVATIQNKNVDSDKYFGDTEVTNEIDDFDFAIDESENDEEEQEEEEDGEEEEIITIGGNPGNVQRTLNDDLTTTTQTSESSFRFLSDERVINQKNNSSFF